MARKPIDFKTTRDRLHAHELFRRHHQGREPADVAELGQWAVGANLPRPIDPFAVLSEEQLRAAVKRIQKGGA
jgi:hypothetical protein